MSYSNKRNSLLYYWIKYACKNFYYTNKGVSEAIFQEKA
jgi:hypothetical protein